ncbi:MAG: hypothetical protein CVU20_03245 [Betaproteobacteria bacterium HGW-Betaproteobacteria-14]|nr:MAG: hypothetical protein CVU20_03245 [Betaproteobacteria bacterium HGW-Betaproteobacteria-14]
MNASHGLKIILVLCLAAAAFATKAQALPGMVTVKAAGGFAATEQRLEKAIAANGMGLVARASASGGAAARGVKIPGNAVLMVFRNDYAVRMLAASVPAGIEAPLRIYLTENPDGSATVSYRRPSAVFAPYASAALDAMAKELDPVFDKIVHDAAGR